MYLRTPKRYKANSRRGCSSLFNFRWLWLYLFVPVALIPLLLIWDYRDSVAFWIGDKVNGIQLQFNQPTPTPTDSPSGYAERWRNAVQSGQMSSAITALRGLTQVLPNEPGVHSTLAQLIILRGAYTTDPDPAVLADAFQAGQDAINANPELPDGWIAEALVLDWSGKPEAALPYVLRAKDLDEKNPMMLTVMAEIYHDLQKDDLADKMVDEAIKGANAAMSSGKATNPADRAALVHAHYVKALILTNTSSDGKDAMREYEEAWRVAVSDPPDLTIPTGYIASPLSLLYMNTQQPQKATDLVTKAIERDKQDPLLQYRLGFIYLNGGDPNKARTYADACHDMDPNQARCLRLLGVLLYREQNYKQSADYYRQLVEKGSKTSADYLNGGLAYIALNQCENAIPMLHSGVGLTQEPSEQASFENALRQCNDTTGIVLETPTPTPAATEPPTAAPAKGGKNPTPKKK